MDEENRRRARGGRRVRVARSARMATISRRLDGRPAWSAPTAPSARTGIAAAGAIMVVLAGARTASAQTFQLRDTFLIGGATADCVAADLNRDGKADIACAVAAAANNVRGLLSTGDDTLVPMPPVTVAGTPTTIDAAELGCDRRIDLVVADDATFIQLLSNDGTGLFTDTQSAVWNIGVGVERALGMVTLAPIPGDAPVGGISLRPAIVGLDLGVESKIVSRVGDGPGTFPGTDEEFVEDGDLIGVACADFNGDGADDVAALRVVFVPHFGFNVRVLLAASTEVSGGITWNSLPEVPVGTSVGIVAGAFNGDDFVDIAVATSTGVDIRLGHGNGTFSIVPAPGLALTGPPAAIVAGDVNDDGVDDLGLMVANGPDMFMASVYVNSGAGAFGPSIPLGTYGQAEHMLIGDVLGTHLGDVAVTNTAASSIDVYEHVQAFDPLCRPDVDLNGTIDFADILEIIINWGPCTPACVQDVDANGDVDFADILEVVLNWGECPEFVGACCLVGSCLDATTVTECLQAGGAFEGYLTLCVVAPCTDLGACCAPDNTCTQLAFADCCFIGGNFQGEGVTCEIAACGIGGCCIDSFYCEELSEPECENQGGKFLGPGTDCDVLCDTGACCLGDGSCVELTPKECFGSFQGFGTICATTSCPPGGGLVCGHPDAGDCFEANGSPFCDNQACCEAVCFFDPFCCEMEWDQICADYQCQP